MALCAWVLCRRPIDGGDARVEVKVARPPGAEAEEGHAVVWAPTGDAAFHRACWTAALEAVRSRKRDRAGSGPAALSPAEKRRLREAEETAEFHDSDAELEAKAEAVANLLRASRHAVAFTGAGVSTAAGIGDFRGKDGKWTQEDRAEASSPIPAQDAEEEVPYEALRPTYTHEAVQHLVALGVLKFVISQNCDGLHTLSGLGPDRLAELHGNVFREGCPKCGAEYSRAFYTPDDKASEYFEELQDTGHTDRPKPRAPECPTCHLTHGTARRCTAAGGRRLCGAALRDTIVNFGDPLPAAHLDAATRHAEQSDLMLCLGSTLQVTPACNLVKRSKHPLGLIIANRQVTPLDERCQRPRPSPRRRSATAPNPAPDPPLPTTFGVRYFGDCDRLLRRVMARLLPAEELAAWDTERVRRAPLYAAQRAEP